MDTLTRQRCYLVRNTEHLLPDIRRERPSLWCALMLVYDGCESHIEEGLPNFESGITTYRDSPMYGLFFGLLTQAAVKSFADDLRNRGLPMGPELEELFIESFRRSGEGSYKVNL